MSDELTVSIDDGIALVTIDRPAKRNALTISLVRRIDEVAAELDAEDSVHCWIVTGSGDRAFCAGADLGELIPLITDEDSAGLSVAVPDRTRRMLSTARKPVVAAVNGACLAGGLELLLGTDLRIAAEHATFGAPEARHGLFAAGGTHVRLTRQIPFAVAQELLLTGRTLTAERAREVGLVNAVVPADQLLDEAYTWARSVCAAGPLAVRASKEAALATQGLEDAFRVESLIGDRVFASQDALEGPRAFLERRQPRFTGR
jgi:enoyl-CoA hydratase